jgi:hypothetical protein
VKTFVLEIWDDEFRLVTYYTVRWDEAEESETEKFFRRFLTDTTHREHFGEIVALLEELGEVKGARQRFFERYADEASELPPKQRIEVDGIEINYRDNMLRLFCTRINDNIVVLFNGGVKSSQATQDSPDLEPKFRDAKEFAKRIWKEIQDEMIVVDDARHKLVTHNGSEELIIY